MTSSSSIYTRDLDRNPANHQPLSPLSFLERSAAVHPERTAVIHGNARLTYRAFYARCRQLASSLTQSGIGLGDTVAAMLANTPPMLEAHYGAPADDGRRTLVHEHASRQQPSSPSSSITRRPRS